MKAPEVGVARPGGGPDNNAGVRGVKVSGFTRPASGVEGGAEAQSR